MKKKMANPGVRFLGTFNQKLRINLSDFNPGNINLIQDRSQHYQRSIYALRSNKRYTYIQSSLNWLQWIAIGLYSCPEFCRF